MYVYAEQLLLENLIINYIILYATKSLTKSDTSKVRILLAAFIGSIYTLIIFIPLMAVIVKVTIKILVTILIVKVAFKPKKFKTFIRFLSVFHLVAFTFAGISLSFLYMINIDTHINGGIFYISNFKIKNLFIAMICGWILFQLIFEYLKNKSSKENIFIFLKVKLKNKEVSLKGMVDTGNSLRDPINKLPVIIVEFMAIKELFPESIQNIFAKYSENNLELFTNVLYNASDDFKFRLIPFKSLGKENGMILGFKPDKVILKIEDEEQIKELIIGVYNKNLSNDDEYKALLHPDIIN